MIAWLPILALPAIERVLALMLMLLRLTSLSPYSPLAVALPCRLMILPLLIVTEVALTFSVAPPNIARSIVALVRV